ncbi:SDR family NAD(P)-dependent oxidoreductase [Phytoactinopolyspora limicola]|uniref:SDR family NAD(P)-dependent oxidoreductase n=1 Tax=Phytoactinopolyspora limicola TaxID=2715536 RepID=UPI00140845D7|nr:SDR family NAD(P)-dependent oxidoreductase [Phytoactinopolyspora limicola]
MKRQSCDTEAVVPQGVAAEARTVGVCIVGAGPAGLAAARALRAHGVPYEHFERHDRVGGIWDVERPGGPMYDSAHFISSRTRSGFHHFPMPDDYPDYPSHRQVLTYVEDFAHSFGLLDAVSFGVEVQRITSSADGWLVETSPVDGSEPPTVRHYRAVICASGAQWFPRIPDSLDGFTGELIPGRDYRNPDPFIGTSTLVIGAGNSGCDIAVDIGRVANRCALSLRRGYWFIPKHISGVPSDTLDDGLEWIPRRLRRFLSELTLRLVVGDLRRFGLPKPDHRLLDSHPTVGTRILDSLAHGDVVARPDIRRVEGRTVEFVDGRREEFDRIIAATGYEPRVPYAKGLITSIDEDELYLGTFSRRHRNLFVLGLNESNSGGFMLFDEAASIVAQYVVSQDRDPSRAARFDERIAHHHPDLLGGLHLSSSPRHQGYVDSGAFVRAIRKTLGDMGWVGADQEPNRSTEGGGPVRERGDLRGEVIALTGATGGLGAHVALRAAARGATIIAIDVDLHRLEHLVRTLPAEDGQKHRAIVCADLADPVAVEQLAQELIALPKLDALVSNAGMAIGGEIDDRTDEDLNREIRVNLVAPLQLTRSVLPRLRASQRPRIVFTGSLGGVIAMGTDPIYAASKFGLRGAALSLHLALRREGIAVSIVQPSAIDTPMLEREAAIGAEPSQFITAPQTPDDVAGTVIRALISPRPETYPQRLDGLLARVAMLAPNMLPGLTRFADRLGRPGLERYRARMRQRGRQTAPDQVSGNPLTRQGQAGVNSG